VVLPALIACVAYWYGRRRLIAERGPGAAPALRAAAFYSGVAAVLLALLSPVDWLALYLLSAHMVQHMLLLVVAAPLIAASTPWACFRAALDPGLRDRWDRLADLADRPGPVGRAVAVATHPVTALTLFVANLWLWHIPAAYDLALRVDPVHDLEHVLYLGIGVLYWSHAVGTSWLAAVLSPGRRLLYLCTGLASMWLLALVLIAQPVAIYAPYLTVVGSVSHMSPITDQRVGIGLMWSVGMIPFDLAIAFAVLRVIKNDEESLAANLADKAI
jgi:cytochrome c oxidase assembly factor CtaG